MLVLCVGANWGVGVDVNSHHPSGHLIVLDLLLVVELDELGNLPGRVSPL